MAIIPAADDLVSRGDQAVPLPLYSQVIGYSEQTCVICYDGQTCIVEELKWQDQCFCQDHTGL